MKSTNLISYSHQSKATTIVNFAFTQYFNVDIEALNQGWSFEAAMQGHHWMLETYWFQFRLEDLTPNMGLYWYFFTEMFPFYRPFFLFVFHTMCFVFLIPLCLRFNDQPLLVLFLQSIIQSMLRPYPTIGDYSLLCILGLIAVSGVLEWWWFLFMSCALVTVLEPVMWHEWVFTESANSNFYYSINLLIGVLHICLMSAVLVHNRNNQQKFKIKRE
eukprot:g5887.t1